MSGSLIPPISHQLRQVDIHRLNIRRLLRLWRRIFISGILVTVAVNYLFVVAQTGIWVSPIDFLNSYALFTQHVTVFLAIFIPLSLLALSDIILEQVTKRRVDLRNAERDRYLSGLAAKYQEIPLVVGDAMSPDLKLQLSAVFQTLVLRRRLFQDGDGDASSENESMSATSIADAFSKGGPRIVILGSPGSGKTTLLYNAVYEYAVRLRGTSQTIPVFLRLSDLASAFNTSGELINGKIAEILQEREAFLTRIDIEMEGRRDIDAVHPGPYAHHIEAQILAGKTLLFLDALDEIDDPSKRAAVARWVTSLPVEQGAAIVVTSRLTEFAASPFKERFTEWQIRDIQGDTRLKLAEALFVPFIKELGITDPRDPLVFVRELEKHAQAASWGGNPLLFSLAAYAFVANGKLPAVRSALYGAVVDALIAAKDADNLSERRRVLGELALSLYAVPLADGGRSKANTKFKLQELPTLLGGVYDPPTVPDLMAEWVKRPAILDSAGRGSYQFRHKTFQEYLAAVALAQRVIRAHLKGDRQREASTWSQITAQRDISLDQWFEPLKLLVGEWCGLTSQTIGRGFARQWLLETFAVYTFHGNDQALSLVLASLAEVNDLAVLGPDFPALDILNAWVQALLSAAERPTNDRYLSLLNQADSVRAFPSRVLSESITNRFIALVKTPTTVAQQVSALSALARLRAAVPVDQLVPILMQGQTPDLRMQAALVLLRQGARGESHALAALQSNDPKVRQAVAQALVDVGEEGRPIFVAALQSDDEEVRRLAAQSVSSIPEPTRGDIALDLVNASMRRDWAAPIFAQLTAPADTAVETWRLRATMETTFGGKRLALEQMARLGADASTLAATRAAVLPSPIRDVARFPQRLANLNFESFDIDGIEVIMPPLATIMAGNFLMGSDKQKDRQAYRRELPQHQVPLGSYQIALYPLTVAEYACFINATGHRVPHEWNIQLKRLDHPITWISWEDAISYVRWLAEVTTELWRLPSEAEWEKAARGIDGRIYPWGDAWDVPVNSGRRLDSQSDRLSRNQLVQTNEQAPHRANTSANGPGTATPVGFYQDGISPYGVYDMAGNVYEWTSTIYKPYPYNATDGRENLRDADENRSRVLRGGSWYHDPRLARSAYRDNFDISDTNGDLGTRLAREFRHVNKSAGTG